MHFLCCSYLMVNKKLESVEIGIPVKPLHKTLYNKIHQYGLSSHSEAQRYKKADAAEWYHCTDPQKAVTELSLRTKLKERETLQLCLDNYIKMIYTAIIKSTFNITNMDKPFHDQCRFWNLILPHFPQGWLCLSFDMLEKHAVTWIS